MPKASPKKSKKASPAQKTKSPPIQKERKKRTKKDPDAPKKAGSGYMIWLSENRPALTKPGMGVVDVAKAAGVAWGKLKDKTEWEKKAADDKKRYEREMAAYKGGASKSPKKSKK